MAFTINICRTTENNMKVGKSYTTIETSVPISPLSTIDMLNPVFIVDYHPAYLTANYVTCAFLKRHYHCTVTVDTAQRMILTCHVDYLSSFNLANCPFHCIRNENVGINKIPDSKLPINPIEKEITSTILQSNFFDKPYVNSYLLAVIGGGT